MRRLGKPTSPGFLPARAAERHRLPSGCGFLFCAISLAARATRNTAGELANGTFYLYFNDKSANVAAVCQAIAFAIHNEMNTVQLSPGQAQETILRLSDEQ
jgi:hypothetical protein